MTMDIKNVFVIMTPHSRALYSIRNRLLYKYGMQVRKRKIKKLDAYNYARMVLMHIFSVPTGSGFKCVRVFLPMLVHENSCINPIKTLIL